MQTILIPTDFNTEALKAIPLVCNEMKEQKLSFIFIHMFKLSDSETDLLMLSRRSREYEQVSDAFYNGCTALKQQYSQISAIRVEFLYGSTLSMFKNFLEDNQVDQVLDIKHCHAGKINRSSIDPAVLIQKSGLPVLSVKPQPVPAQIIAAKTEPELAEA
ncbi:hypothetical protein LJ707_18710 [Mucilaginibacter sp. UR6-1]|uniref:hypothetical protein n=1 Tax=Mucilaginibacter sp. UR6-1 TaxID=1435643 RepID=UPI001E65D7A1|nr:hypothetical protein [Mucilaginibacter sp. UR6-1]MCC8410979.1 hypothetical protein [Mucilaginibacter sp. UR6-1]